MKRSIRRPGWPIVVAVAVVIGVVLLIVLAGEPRGAGTASRAPAVSASSETAAVVPPSSSPQVPVATRPASTPSPGPEPSSRPATSGDTTAGVPLADLLARLTVAAEQRAGYDRDLFEHWIDADGNGCNTRNEVLIQEAVIAPSIGEGCLLTGGSWFSAYDGRSFSVPGALDIDHVVALAEAWDSGAFGWTAERRRAYANDLDVPFALIAVSAGSNRSKSDLDPADWLPPAAADRCPYVGAWLAVKARWSLAVDAREQAALESLAADCPATTMLFEVAPAAGPSPLTTSTPGAAASCDAAYPSVCIPPAPPDLDCGEIAFRRFVVLAPDPHRFDGDHDGIGCET